MKKTIVIVGDIDKAESLINKLHQICNIVFVDMNTDAMRSNNFEFPIIHHINTNKTINEIQSLSRDVAHIIPGAEIGVELCDALNQSFGITWNDPSKASARRDKFEMQEALSNSGINHINGFISSDLRKTLVKINNELSYPIVIKPLKSAASDNVYVCQNESVLIDKFNVIVGSKDIFNNYNSSVLVQEFINGTEYVVDTMSIDNEGVICAVWKYTKIISTEGNILYRSMELENTDSPAAAILIPYAHTVLSAVGIKNGPSHQEIMLTDGRPVLIEVGARVHGGAGGYIGAEATTHSQTDLLVDILTGKSLFNGYVKNNNIYSTNDKLVKEVFLISKKSGVVNTSFINEKLSTLHSFFSLKKTISANDVIEKTINLRTSPTSILLVGSKETVLLDEEEIYRMEENEGLYSFQ